MNIADIAALAALELTPEETQVLERDLPAILAYVDQLGRINTDGVEPMAHLGAHLSASSVPPGATPRGGPRQSIDPEATLRADAVRSSFPVAAALANAPAQAGGMFEVPKIVDRG